ncbi:hypothetical protein FEM03_07390 [Phragmitibacter flavus]|uniref:CobQ/CobB/MinD/ParA nucleotide binding domain-containing protein n=1 Tax=Phragmitibacter flavus TaxID=2576071 RepID=A0A5R8KGC5_9BACT|nr:hypothetical protein [Phragmitibacter flavus]TLD71346.1 hypothetical protein FEM03_07390 [Phragmitibacter flavus]
MSKRLVIILNGKGGVGKSFFATNLVQYFKDKKVPHQAIDTDNENSTLKRYHFEADFVDLNDPRGLDSLFAAVEASSLVVMDGRAASTDLILDYFAEVSAFDLLDGMDARLTLVIPVNHEADSVTQAKLIAETLGNRCQYVIVKNQAHSEHFVLYEKSRTRSHLMDELHAREITMPKMYDWLVAALNQHNLTATAAFGHPAFNLVDRQRLKNWQKSFNTAVDEHREVLLPQPPSSSSHA